MTLKNEPNSELSGIFAAAVTPLTSAGQPDVDALPALLDFLAGRDCHGVLVLGTTGECYAFDEGKRGLDLFHSK